MAQNCRKTRDFVSLLPKYSTFSHFCKENTCGFVEFFYTVNKVYTENKDLASFYESTGCFRAESSQIEGNHYQIDNVY